MRGERDGTGIGRQETLDNHGSSFPCGNKLLFQENFRIWSLEVKFIHKGFSPVGFMKKVEREHRSKSQRSLDKPLQVLWDSWREFYPFPA